MKFPITLKYIPKFEMMNALSINVFTIKEEEILLLLLSKSHYTHRTKYYKLTFALMLIKRCTNIKNMNLLVLLII
jgi:exosortase/archaeosortase